MQPPSSPPLPCACSAPSPLYWTHAATSSTVELVIPHLRARAVGVTTLNTPNLPVRLATVAMTTSRPSQFADQPFDVAVVGTESLVENWLKARKVTDSPEVGASHSLLFQCTDYRHSLLSPKRSHGTTAASAASRSQRSSAVCGKTHGMVFARTVTVFRRISTQLCGSRSGLLPWVSWLWPSLKLLRWRATRRSAPGTRTIVGRVVDSFPSIVPTAYS